MREVVWNLLQLFAYWVLFLFLLIISLKIIGSIFSPNFEKEITENRNLGLSFIVCSLFIAIAILFSSIIR